MVQDMKSATDKNKLQPKSEWVVIPAFNEEYAIKKSVEGLKHYFNNIIVVDDCSTDATGKIAKETGALVLRHALNLGQGAALHTGVQYAIKFKQASEIIMFDADGQHRPLDAKNMLDELRANNLDVILGSRFIAGKPKTIPKIRLVLLQLAIKFTQLTTKLEVSDTHNGLRVFSAKAYSKLSLFENRMAHASEILKQIKIQELNFTEFQTEIDYSTYSLSKGQRSIDAINVLVDLFTSRLLK